MVPQLLTGEQKQRRADVRSVFLVNWQTTFCQKLSPEMKHDIWLFPKINYAFKGRRFQDIEGKKKNVTMAL